MGIVITRPAAAARPLAEALARAGARPVLFPALAIESLPEDDTLRAAVASARVADMAIFVSANAVHAGVPRLRAAGAWPATATRIAAVGSATAQALHAEGIAEVLHPAGGRQDSEALLALPELQDVRGRAIAIVRGVGGREQLRDTLSARGATVAYVECYRRVRPAPDVEPLAAAWSRGEIDAVSALSIETLDHFVALVEHDARVRLADVTLVVPHPAVAAAPNARRFARVVVGEAGADGIARALAV